MARAPPNIFLNIKGETLVELCDDSYYFWNPGTNTFLTYDKPFCSVIGASTARFWEVRRGWARNPADGSQKNYYTFWCPELLHDNKRRCVLDLCHSDLSSGTKICVHIKHDGNNQKWVLKSDGDKDG